MTPDLKELEDAIAGILHAHCTPRQLRTHEGDLDAGLWELLDGSGFCRIGTPEMAGGSGGTLAEAVTVVRSCGAFGAQVPIGEASLVAFPLLAASGLTAPDGVITAGAGKVIASRHGLQWRLQGTLRRVAYGRRAAYVVGTATADSGAVLFVAPTADTAISRGLNLANEPRDDIDLDCLLTESAVASVPVDVIAEFQRRGALASAVVLAGAIHSALTASVRYTNERVQFGRPIAKFQAIQQQLALLAAEVSAARAATDGAVRACAAGFAGTDAEFAIAAAKVRTAQAAGMAASIAHQVHGAIGMTQEHALRFTTTRLWSWRSEWLGELAWADDLGRSALSADDAGLWSLLTGC